METKKPFITKRSALASATDFNLAREITRNLIFTDVKGFGNELGIDMSDEVRVRQLMIDAINKVENYGPHYFSNYKDNKDLFILTVDPEVEKDLIDGLWLLSQVPEIMDALGGQRVDESEVN